MVWNADCSLEKNKFSVSFIIIFGALSFAILAYRRVRGSINGSLLWLARLPLLTAVSGKQFSRRWQLDWSSSRFPTQSSACKNESFCSPRLHSFFNQLPKLDTGQTLTFSPPGCATSRLRPANQLHFFAYSLAPSTECRKTKLKFCG